MAASTTPTSGNSGRGFARFMEQQQDRVSVLLKCLRHPRRAYSRLQTDFLSPDPVYVEQSQWIHGTLRRIALNQLLPHSRDYDLKLIRPLDRTWGTSITTDELCCLLAIAKSVQARKILEIGTFDGNTTVNLAENTGGTVVTVDLAPDGQQVDGIPNMTDRMQLGRQIRGHPCEPRIRQVFGDSTRLDWKALGAPFDLIFIDGAHHYEFVASDTRNARACVAPNGAIVWHDYAIFRDVSRVVDETAATSSELEVSAIEGTRLAVGFRRK
jgi:predicted O-methyltransferase YrrM